MCTIKISVTNKTATAEPDSRIVCGNKDYRVFFTFDDEWANHGIKTARFIHQSQGRLLSYDQVFTGTECPVPLLADTTEVKIGVYAGDLSTTTPAVVPCDRSILCDNPVHEEPPEDVYNQLVELVESGAVKGEPGKDAIIDQTYNAESENAQSGKAVAEALEGAELENYVKKIDIKDATLSDWNDTGFYAKVGNNDKMVKGSREGDPFTVVVRGNVGNVNTTLADSWVIDPNDNQIGLTPADLSGPATPLAYINKRFSYFGNIIKESNNIAWAAQSAAKSALSEAAEANGIADKAIDDAKEANTNANNAQASADEALAKIVEKAICSNFTTETGLIKQLTESTMYIVIHGSGSNNIRLSTQKSGQTVNAITADGTEIPAFRSGVLILPKGVDAEIGGKDWYQKRGLLLAITGKSLMGIPEFSVNQFYFWQNDCPPNFTDKTAPTGQDPNGVYFNAGYMHFNNLGSGSFSIWEIKL